MIAIVRLLEEEKRLSGRDQQRRQNSSKASLGLVFRETWNAFLTHVMSQSGDGKGNQLQLSES